MVRPDEKMSLATVPGMGEERVNHSDSPDMSVVIVTPDNYQVIRKTIRHLRAQTIKDRLEIVISAPSEKELDLIESDLEGFQLQDCRSRRNPNPSQRQSCCNSTDERADCGLRRGSLLS